VTGEIKRLAASSFEAGLKSQRPLEKMPTLSKTGEPRAKGAADMPAETSKGPRAAGAGDEDSDADDEPEDEGDESAAGGPAGVEASGEVIDEDEVVKMPRKQLRTWLVETPLQTLKKSLKSRLKVEQLLDGKMRAKIQSKKKNLVYSEGMCVDCGRTHNFRVKCAAWLARSKLIKLAMELGPGHLAATDLHKVKFKVGESYESWLARLAGKKRDREPERSFVRFGKSS
jgi:hypothetical protein